MTVKLIILVTENEMSMNVVKVFEGVAVMKVREHYIQFFGLIIYKKMDNFFTLVLR